MKETCNCCGKQAELRYGYCWKCAEAETIIEDGTDMYDVGLDGEEATTAMDKPKLLVHKGWIYKGGVE